MTAPRIMGMTGIARVGKAAVFGALCLAVAAACTDGKRYAHAVCVLVDTSGTYADHRAEAMRLVKQGILPKLLPGDSLFVLGIDSNSYEKDNMWGSVTLATRPSQANAQKAEFARRLDTLGAAQSRARYTDIQGAMMLCSEYLAQSEAGARSMVVFSDMQEELKQGTKRQLDENELAGIRVLAMNVKRLNADGQDPRRYRERLASWQKTVQAHGAASWQVVLEPTRLVEHLAAAR